MTSATISVARAGSGVSGQAAASGAQPAGQSGSASQPAASVLLPGGGADPSSFNALLQGAMGIAPWTPSTQPASSLPGASVKTSSVAAGTGGYLASTQRPIGWTGLPGTRAGGLTKNAQTAVQTEAKTVADDSGSSSGTGTGGWTTGVKPAVVTASASGGSASNVPTNSTAIAMQSALTTQLPLTVEDTAATAGASTGAGGAPASQSAQVNPGALAGSASAPATAAPVVHVLSGTASPSATSAAASAPSGTTAGPKGAANAVNVASGSAENQSAGGIYLSASGLQGTVQSAQAVGTDAPKTASLNAQSPDAANVLKQYAVQQAMAGNGTLQVQVQPQHLGPIVIAATSQPSGVQVQITAANPETLQWLGQQQSDMADAIRSAGVSLANLQVASGGTAFQSGGGSMGNPSRQGGSDTGQKAVRVSRSGGTGISASQLSASGGAGGTSALMAYRVNVQI
ncbi:flagellar hook-length control protein FliK [Alicyclobacillus cycloheptanicus]|uniref:Flagellar hook-length control protein-like C-terminal domain-containing protein n=1 Tax=Alicyclobacillus cycloheptanicus TaxID=1457 RepID=A0ABT9XJR8_9BACL|nr:flagellar hook-length control protein FliK [Alicyclobacillus cycloheptanicus]MDQ0190555.1 hypothetical protein [Alicyclobacillus cycloheptanicus]WDM01397.1 flagellar hook-length control protein FliK [Alicyclobacillus cycloheptanicus]